jgi:hypothetical protein
VKTAYKAPKVVALGDVRKLTRSGSPNQAFDGGGLFDIDFGPRDPEPNGSGTE